MLVNIIQVCLNNLLDAYTEDSMYYMPKQEAYEKIKQVTQQDFGYDVKAWKEWIRKTAEIRRN